MDKCKLIHPGKIKDVEQQLYYLQKRSLDNATSGSSRPATSSKSLQRLDAERVSTSPAQSQSRNSFYADEEDGEEFMPLLENIEEYIEGLYEEMPDKIISTRNILQLARVPHNMQVLTENESLISALSRVLREDGKKSMVCVAHMINSPTGTRHQHYLRILLLFKFFPVSSRNYVK